MFWLTSNNNSSKPQLFVEAIVAEAIDSLTAVSVQYERIW